MSKENIITMVRVSYCAVIVVCLAFIFCGCTVNLTSRHLESQLDDLTQRTQKSEQAHAVEQQNIYNLSTAVGDLQRRLPVAKDEKH